MTTTEPLISPAVRRRLARLGLSPEQAPAGSGLGGRVTPADLPPSDADGSDPGPTGTADALGAPTRSVPPIGPVLERARRRREDLTATAQLTSVTELDVTTSSGLPTAGGPSPERRAAAARDVLADVVAAIHAAVRADPRLAATSDADLVLLRIPDAIDVGVVTSDPQGRERRLVLRDPGAAGSTRAAVLALLGTPGPPDDDPLLPIAAPVVVRDRTTSGVDFETTLLERPAALSLCLGALARQVRATAGPEVGVRWTAMLSVTYDHRVIDGADAARLLATIRASVARSG